MLISFYCDKKVSVFLSERLNLSNKATRDTFPFDRILHIQEETSGLRSYFGIKPVFTASLVRKIKLIWLNHDQSEYDLYRAPIILIESFLAYLHERA